PRVEQWVAAMAVLIEGVLQSVSGFWSADGKQRFQMVLATAVTLHDLLAGLAPCFQRMKGGNRRGLSFVAHVIGCIRRGLLWTIVRDLLTGEAFAAGHEAFLREYRDFLGRKLKLYALPSRPEFGVVRAYVERLAADQEDLAEIEATWSDFQLLPALAATLGRHPLLG